MARVTGIGGIFFKAQDQAKSLEWYRKHLGIESAEWGGCGFTWREATDPDEIGYTVWSPFKGDTDYFDPGRQPFMVNYRVDDLPAMLEALRAEGVEIVGDMIEEENGKFAWILDPDGQKVELWEPVPSAEDPYLPES